jgi:N-methylhydantoinase B
MPGGGGYGDPFARDPALVARDVRYGLIKPDQAEAEYGVVLTTKGEVNAAATNRRRASR